MKLKSWLKELPYTLLQGSLETEVDEVVYDSRKAAPGTVFVCMRGANVDSHTFIPDVVEKGAPVLVVEHPVEAPENVTVIQVKNGRNALSLLSAARFDYPARKMTAIGVTGTKGKTTTTYMIKAILEAAGQKTGLIGTNGAVIGENHYPTKNTTPESYILQEYFAKMVEAGCRYIVMEVSSQSYLMHRVDGLFFDYGIFLNISNDHIGPNEHASFEEYLYYKKQLLKNCRTALVNRDDPHFDAIVEGATAEILTFSLERAADFTAQAELAAQLDADGVCCRVSQLAVNGRDLMAAGIPAGPGLRRTLEALLDAVIRGQLPNERQRLLDAAGQISAS